LQGGEDIEFVRRALKHGERLIYIPEILQYHHVEKEKLALHYLIRKAYYRSMAAYELNEEISSGPTPLYLYRMAITYLVKSVFSLRHSARRYYLVKLASVIGEMQGHRKGHLNE
jgi:GT2 family glycosyltransferase